MNFDRTVSPVPPKQLSQNAGHHWLIERTYDGHHHQTICLQWQPTAKTWCHSGDVATGREVDTRGWLYDSPCPMPQEKITYTETVKEESVFTHLVPTNEEALDLQLRSMLFMECEKRWGVMSKEDKKKWCIKNKRTAFYKINEVSVGKLLATLSLFGIPVSVTVGEE